jgi:UDP-glucose 4-epimerase
LNILVTGGAGFIASHIVDKYIEDGHNVIVIDDLSSGIEKHINPKAEFYNLNLYKNPLGEILKKHKIEIINHHAAQINLGKSILDPIYDAKVNIEGSLNILQEAINCNVKKIIFASSGGAIYGEQNSFPANETHTTNPLSPYGISKLAVEKYLHFYKSYYNLDFVILRYSNVFGPRQGSSSEAGVVSIFCRKLIEGINPVINGDGLNTRDYVYVKDVVVANLKALSLNISEYFNISTAKETNVNEIFYLINDFCGNLCEEMHKEPIPGEQKRSVLDNSKAKRILNWKPETNIKEGIEETCNWFKENYESLN